LYPDLREAFGQDLVARGFVAIGSDAAAERWSGDIVVVWDDPSTGEPRHSTHRVQIAIAPGFPFRRPTVWPIDTDPPIAGSRHQAPGPEAGALCLWPADGPGWDPWMGAEGVLERAATWFRHYHRDDWPPHDRPPDLHLYFPANGQRALMLVGDDWTPPVEETTGRFLVRQRDAERAFAEAPGAGAAVAQDRRPDRALVQMGLADAPAERRGVWFRLRREPRPQTLLGPLLSEIDAATEQPQGWALSQFRGLVGDTTHRDGVRPVVALGYPGADGEEHWLFLGFALPGGLKGWRRPQVVDGIPIFGYEAAGIDQTSLMRRTGHVAHALENRGALIFGVGAVGSTIALLLVKAGLPKLRLSDSARMRPGNAVRHVAGLGGVGNRKTLMTMIEMLRHAPDCVVRREDESWDPSQLLQWIQEADVVIDATANPAFSLLLNELCLRAGQPALYVATHRRAAIGRIRVVRPGRDACLVCHDLGYAAADDRADYPLIPAGEEGEFVEAGCGVPTVEASTADVEAAANWASRTALWLLQEKLGDDNLCLVINDALPDLSGVLGDVGIHGSRWEPMAGCDSCPATA
jgi:molybdopterin/thiamine biosynthesis adenylyltransferase